MLASTYHPTTAGTPAEELTIDELARVTGTTVRNVRAHQSRGLLPPPTIRARTGYYGPEHVARLRMLHTMQEEGFRLEAIQRLLERPGGAAEQIFDFGRALQSAFGDGAPEFATSSELEQRLGEPLDSRLLRKAEKLGLIRPLGSERAYLQLFLSDVMGDLGLSERPAEQWARLSDALERLRPLAVEAIRASFEQAMSETVDRQLSKLVDSR